MTDASERGDVSLEEILSASPVREKAVAATVALIRSEVERKRGVSGVAVRTGYAVVDRVKPTMVEDIVRATLPAFCRALQPQWAATVAESEPAAAGQGGAYAARSRRLEQRLNERAAEVADALLAVSDGKIDGARPAIARAYRMLRPSAREHVLQAVPGLAVALRDVLASIA